MKVIFVTSILAAFLTQTVFAQCSEAYLNRNLDISVPTYSSVQDKEKDDGFDNVGVFSKGPGDDIYQAMGRLLAKLEKNDKAIDDELLKDPLVAKLDRKISRILKQEKCETGVNHQITIQHLRALNEDGSLCPKVKILKKAKNGQTPETKKVVRVTLKPESIAEMVVAKRILKEEKFEIISNKDFEYVK